MQLIRECDALLSKNKKPGWEEHFDSRPLKKKNGSQKYLHKEGRNFLR